MKVYILAIATGIAFSCYFKYCLIDGVTKRLDTIVKELRELNSTLHLTHRTL